MNVKEKAATLTNEQLDKICEFLLAAKWDIPDPDDDESTVQLMNILEEFDWDAQKAAVFHINKQKVEALTEEERNKIDRFLSQTQREKPAPGDNAGMTQMINILEAFGWNTEKAVLFHNRQRMNEKERVASLSKEERAIIQVFLNETTWTAPEPGDYKGMAKLVRTMDAFDWDTEKAFSYWKTGALKAEAAYRKVFQIVFDKVEAGELQKGTKESEDYIKGIKEEATKAYRQAVDKAFHDQVHNRIDKKLGL